MMNTDLPTELEIIASQSGSYGTHQTLKRAAAELRRLYRIVDTTLAVGLATGGVKTQHLDCVAISGCKSTKPAIEL